jgi:poly-beta-1,6-N-acetyl-D-glucosamine biosynthesis protein PgaD
MDESRQRNRDIKEVVMPDDIEIRDNPGVKTFLRTITELSITGLVWGIWIYLLLPIVNVLLWILGFRYFYVEVFEKVGYLEFFELISKMGWIILIVFVIFRSWGYYNYWRFGKRNKRRNVSASSINQFAEYFKIHPEEVKELMSKKEIIWPLQ